ncbi:MAG TPA: LemA family protein [Candidatus Hydrogenedens sp.]|nr:LemA family protein [Candidatus Hydrogenedens sp.]
MTTGILIAVLVFLVLLVLFFISTYNRLVRLLNEVKNAWSQIDVQLKRRHDLIPNLVETVKGYMQHERATLENITQARNLAMKPGSVSERAQAEQQLTQALHNFFVVVENYPDLKANQNFLALQEELTSTENRISFARQAYNDTVMNFNNAIQMFPTNIVGAMFGFKEQSFFELENVAERAVPKVSFQ